MSEQRVEERRRQGNVEGRARGHDEERDRKVEQKSGPVRGRKRLIAGIAVLLVAIAAFVWWLHARKFEDTDDAQVDGYISSISSRVTGTVIRVAVEDNQAVKQGDVLVELDATDLEVALAPARADVTQAAVASARKRVEQRVAKLQQAQARLGEARANAPRQLVAREAGVSVRQANLELAQAQLRQAQLNVGYAKVTAPVSGVIGKRMVNLGDRVQPGQQLMSLMQTGELWVTANFRETQIERMQPGQTVSVHVDALDRDYD